MTESGTSKTAHLTLLSKGRALTVAVPFHFQSSNLYKAFQELRLCVRLLKVFVTSVLTHPPVINELWCQPRSVVLAPGFKFCCYLPIPPFGEMRYGTNSANSAGSNTRTRFITNSTAFSRSGPE